MSKHVYPRLKEGDQFNYLTVIEYGGRQKAYKYKCECVCGKITYVVSTNLRNGRAKSCGCKASEFNIKNLPRKQRVTPIINKMFRDYKLGATTRNYEFDLSLSEFEVLIFRSCHYCGSPPSTPKKSRAVKEANVEDLYVNGIDRLDNSKGYHANNVVPCCKTCNYAKGPLTVEEWISWIRRVITYKYSENKNTLDFNIRSTEEDGLGAITLKLYRGYRNDAKKRGYEFSLPYDDFSVLIQNNCSYCNSPPSTKKSPRKNKFKKLKSFLLNGVDRIDNSIGYAGYNCVPCCKICNYAKHKLDFSDWIKWLENIRLYNYPDKIKPS
jgi:hypothetical protein